jgi:hypothetical protein
MKPFLKLCIAAALALSFGSASAHERHDVWDLHLGQSASALPRDFVEFACGTNGGPPARPLGGFADYLSCKAGKTGLYEVYFRYNDEDEYVARALEQAQDIERLRGTRVFGFDSTISALLNSAGVLSGVRIVSDPRGVEPGTRNDQWRLGALLMRHFGTADWACQDVPLGERESAVTSFFVKKRCTKRTAEAVLSVEQDYYHRRGESFTDEFGKVQPTYFVSTSRFEMLAVDASD